jgi:hypothetical protein
VAAAVPLLRPGPDPATVAMGPGELSPSLTRAVEDCLGGYPDAERFAGGPKFPVTVADLAVAVRHGDRTAAVFLTGEGSVTCERTDDMIMNGEPVGSFGAGEWTGTRNWLPGPVQLLMHGSSDTGSGPVAVDASGRVSARVARLELRHDDGEVTAARIANGTFGLLSEVERGQRAMLAAYDVQGVEIWRKPFFDDTEPAACWADPSGVIVYPAGDPATVTDGCLPAEPWKP